MLEFLQMLAIGLIALVAGIVIGYDWGKTEYER